MITLKPISALTLDKVTAEESSLDSTNSPTLNPLELDSSLGASTEEHPPQVESDSISQKELTSTTLQTIAGIAGNVLEWYDFAVFGFFGDVIGAVFFPPQAGNAAIVESFAVFGGAFVMRPIGGMLLGTLGDLYGRKRALVASIFLMAVPTFAMGCLPSYQSVGPLAIVLLLLVRMLQGLSVGGQLMSSLVFTLEHHPPSQWGLYGSYVMASANFGTFLGGVVGFTLRSSLTDLQLHTWGWRIPFLSGVVVSLSGIYLKYYCPDDEETPETRSNAASISPIRRALAKENRRSLLASALVPMLWSAGFYLSFVWMSIYMHDLVDTPVPYAFGVNSASLLVSVCLLFPVAGKLSDYYGRKRIMTMGGVGMGVLSPLLVTLIGRAIHPYQAFLAQSTLGVALSLWGAPMCAWLVESFDPAARLTSVAIGYNLAQATVGGMTPSLATIMVDTLGVDSPGYLLTALASSSLIGLWLVAPPAAAPAGPPRRAFSVLPGEEDGLYRTNEGNGIVNKDDEDENGALHGTRRRPRNATLRLGQHEPISLDDPEIV